MGSCAKNREEAQPVTAPNKTDDSKPKPKPKSTKEAPPPAAKPIVRSTIEQPPPPEKPIFKYAPFKDFQYEILKDKLDGENDRVKTIQDETSKKVYVLKYLLGTAQHLKKIETKIQVYSALRFAYLAPIHKTQPEPDQLLVLINFYENSADRLLATNRHKCDKLILLFRLARVIQYLERNNIRHNKIQLPNIFAGKRNIYLGLPSWNSAKEKQVTPRVQHITAFANVFTAFFPENAASDEAIANLIKQMKNCANNQISIDSIIKTIMTLNFLDEPKIVDQKKKTIIEYLEGAKYEGEVDQSKNKEGYGIMTEGQSEYWGKWVNNRRSNRGNWKGKDYCYVGEWKNDQRQGFGLQINQRTHEYYEGDYLSGKKNGYGIWEGPKGEIYAGDWKENRKEGFGVYYDGNNQFYYEGRWKEDMKNGKGREVHSNGIFYEGTFKDNLKDGQGKYIHPNRFQYNGEFNNNIITGYGVLIDKDGNKYTGDLVNGEFEGRGKYENKDNTYFYDGQWRNGERHGDGLERTKDSEYIGGFVRNIREGKGTLKELNEKYIGDFKKGKATGNGEYYYENMDIYRGGFIDKIKNGKGIYISAVDGSTYDGHWHNDQKHGKGKHTLITGEYYDGEWVDSKREGYGTQFTNPQNKYEGYWKNDKKQGKGVQLEGGNRYEGQFVNGLKHSSFGTLAFTNGDRYEGSFVSNKQEGKGKYTWRNGDEYIGEYVGGNREGQGTMHYKEKKVTYEGGWKKDKREGPGKEIHPDGEFVGEFVDDMKQGMGTRTFVDEEGVSRLVGPWVNDKRHGEFDNYFPDQTSEKREYFNDREINLGMTAVHY